MTTDRRHQGFTLIEVLIASTILTAAVAGLVMPFSIAAEHQQVDAVRTTAATLMTQMTERLNVKAYDDILAMDGYSESGAEITDLSGVRLNDSSLAGFTIRISASEVRVPVGDETPDEAMRFCLATVTVSHAQINDVSVNRLFTR